MHSAVLARFFKGRGVVEAHTFGVMQSACPARETVPWSDARIRHPRIVVLASLGGYRILAMKTAGSPP